MSVPESALYALRSVVGGAGAACRGAAAALLLALAVGLPARSAEPATENVRLSDGSTLTVFFAVPEEAPPGKRLPLCIALPGGPGEEGMAKGVMAGMGSGFLARGWAVAAPVSPNGAPFFGGNAKLVPLLIAALQTRATVASGKVLLAGVSNGGIAAIEIAANMPARVFAVVSVPGVVSPRTKLQKLWRVPIYLRIGENDELHWGEAYPLVVGELNRVGAAVNARLVPNVGHGVTVDWADLDKWLAQLSAVRTPKRPGAR